VAQAFLPALGIPLAFTPTSKPLAFHLSIPQTAPGRIVWLTLLRETFERLHDAKHRLRKAVNELGTLEIVRIIEGRA
jgi:hypothetical protein